MNTFSSTLTEERSNGNGNGDAGHEHASEQAPDVVRPIQVALVNDYEIILRGLHSMLAPFSDRIEVVEHDTDGTPDKHADVALFDTFASRRDALERARQMIAERKVRHVVLYTFDAAEEFLTIARDIGVSGVVLKSATGDVLATALERVVAGERVGLDDVVRATRSRTSKDLSRGNRKCSPSSRSDAPMPRSASSCSSPSTLSRRTYVAYSPSSGSTTAHRRRCTPPNGR